MVLMLALGIYVAWFFGFVLCCKVGISLIIAGIMTAKNRNTANISKIKKQKDSSALHIIIGVVMIVVSFIMLITALDCIRRMDASNGNDFLNKAFELFARGILLIQALFAVCHLPVIVLFLVKGIQMTMKLKTIDDADTYSKKHFRAAFLITFGALGTVISTAFSTVRVIAFSIRSTVDENDYHSLTFYIDLTTAAALFILGVIVYTAILWGAGIRTARKLKTIDDGDTYKKNIVRTATLVISGALGTVISIVLLIKFIPDFHFYLQRIIETIDLYL